MSTDPPIKRRFMCIISGPMESGILTFCVRFLQNLMSLCTKQSFKGGFVWRFSERTAIPSKDFDALKFNIR